MPANEISDTASSSGSLIENINAAQRQGRIRRHDASGMFEAICSNGFSDSDIVVCPAIMSMVDGAAEIRLGAAARRGDYCLSLIKEQTMPFVRES